MKDRETEPMNTAPPERRPWHTPEVEEVLLEAEGSVLCACSSSSASAAQHNPCGAPATACPHT